MPNLRLAASVRHNARRRGRRRYNTLAFCNCLRTGSVRGKEIDFVATRGQDEKLYIQVAYEITENNREREFGNLEAIRDNYPKMVLSRDRIPLSAKRNRAGGPSALFQLKTNIAEYFSAVSL